MLEKLFNCPTPKNTKRLLIFGVILMIIVYPFMAYFFFASHYPVFFFESQLSFSGETIKSHLKTMNSEEINLYRIGQSFDYAYMVSYASLYFSLTLIISRKFNENSKMRNSCLLVAIFGPIAACCDAMENVFILLMLSDPQGFPNVWAITHSWFALVKFILIGILFTWIIIALIALLVRKKPKPE